MKHLLFSTVLAAPALALAAPPALNLPQTLADTKAILAAGGQADIVVLGDSLSARAGSYLPVFRSLMQQQYGNAGGGYQGASVWTGAGFNPGWQGGVINGDTQPRHSLDGLWSTYNGTAPYPNQAYVTPVDRTVQLQYMTRPDGGSFEIRQGRDGGVSTTVSTAGPAGQVRTVDHTLGRSMADYTIQPLGDGPVTILGQNNLRDEPGVRIHRAANGGWGVNNFLARDGTFDQQLDLLSPDLVMVWLGQNDQAHNRYSYAQQVWRLIDRIEQTSPDAEVLLVGTYDQGSPVLAELVEGMASVAGARDGVGFINVYSTAGDADFFQSSGFVDDGVHFSPAGGQYVGQMLYNAFVTDGASLVPEPAIFSLVAPMMLGLRRRRASGR